MVEEINIIWFKGLGNFEKNIKFVSKVRQSFIKPIKFFIIKIQNSSSQ